MPFVHVPIDQQLQQAIALVHPRKHGFRAGNVAHLEAFWRLINGDFVSAGFVVRLDDGRRFHLIYDSDDTTADRLQRLEAEPLAPDQPLPEQLSGEPRWTTTDRRVGLRVVK